MTSRRRSTNTHDTKAVPGWGFRAVVTRALFSVFLCLASVSPAFAQTVAADFRVTSDWQTGFVGEIALTNTGSAPISGWTLEFDLGGQLAGLWNGQPAVS